MPPSLRRSQYRPRQLRISTLRLLASARIASKIPAIFELGGAHSGGIMTTAVQSLSSANRRPDYLSGTPRAGAIDRWIYVFTAASFIVIALAGFIPDSAGKIAAVRAGASPPFPLVLHMHAVLMGSFLTLLLAQTWLMASGREDQHRRLGLVAMVLVPALVVVGFVLVPVMYHAAWATAQAAPAAARDGMAFGLGIRENIVLLQLRVGLTFPLLLFIGLRARATDPGLHKRMMILATVMALPAGIDRISWLPTTLPASPLATDLYTVLAISPMLAWDLYRNRSLNKAYWIWFAVFLAGSLAVNLLWDRPWWHAVVRQLMGV